MLLILDAKQKRKNVVFTTILNHMDEDNLLQINEIDEKMIMFLH